MRKTFFGVLVGIALGSLGVVVAQTPTIFANIRVNGFSDLRGTIVNNTGDVTVNDNLVVTGNVEAPDGSGTDPSYSFSGETSSGMWLDVDELLLQGVNAEGSLRFLAAGGTTLGGSVSVTLDSPLVDFNGLGDGLTLNGDSGTSGQALTSNGMGMAPTWEDVGISFPILAPNGSFDAPSYSFTNEPTAGLYSDGTTATFGNSNGVDTISYLQLDDTLAVLLSDDGMGASFLSLDLDDVTVQIDGQPSLIWELDGIETPNLVAAEFGFKGVPQNPQTASYNILLADAGRQLYHASGAGAGDTYTIQANATVAFPIGSVLTFINTDSNDLTIASGDTVTQAGSAAVTPCTLAENGMATAVKIDTTAWLINGTGLTCT